LIGSKLSSFARCENAGLSILAMSAELFPNSLVLANPAPIGDFERPSRHGTRRMALIVPVEISGKDIARSSFSVFTTATNLSQHGVMLHVIATCRLIPCWW